MDQMGDHMKMIFWVLSNSEIKITNRAVKVDVICLVSFVSYGPLIVQKGSFFSILSWPQQEI